jgi:hypothetical protein
MNSAVYAWANKHGVSMTALNELQGIFGMHGGHDMPPAAKGNSEAAVQVAVRLEAARKGVRLFRNNVGALIDSRGVPIRYGLANESKQLNQSVKSADLIGWRPVIIGQYCVAQFVSRECKRVGWHYTGDAHEQAQLAWAQLVTAAGGDAAFCTGEGTL